MFIFLVFCAGLVLLPVLALACFAWDREGWSLLWFAAFVTLLFFFSNSYPEHLSLWTWLQSLTWTDMLIYTGYYAAAGVVVSLLKWYMDRREDAADAGAVYASALRNYHNDGFAESFTETGECSSVKFSAGLHKLLMANAGSTPMEQQAYFKKIFARAIVIDKKSGAGPRFSESEYNALLGGNAFTDMIVKKMSDKLDSIAWWMCQWPVTLLCMVFEDLIVKVCKEIAIILRKWYDWAGRLAYRDVENPK